MGIFPVSSLEKRNRDSKKVRLERLGGMEPLRPLDERSRNRRVEKRPSEGEIDPVSDELVRLSPTTVLTESNSPPHVTPLQLQNSVLFSDQSLKTFNGSSKNDSFTSKSNLNVEE